MGAQKFILICLCGFVKCSDIKRSWIADPKFYYQSYPAQSALDVLGYSAIPSVFIDSGLSYIGVTTPSKEYLPPAELPDYANGYHYPRPEKPIPEIVTKPSTTTVRPGYLPPTSTEFQLPEVIDAKNAGQPSVTRTYESQVSNANKVWKNVYRDGHSMEAIEIIEMKCDNGIEGSFRVNLRRSVASPQSELPLLEDALTSTSACSLRQDARRITIDIPSASYSSCGVTDCSTSVNEGFLCLRLRFPRMKSLRLIDDDLLKLRCRLQEAVAIHTKRLEMPVSGAVNVRSSKTANTLTGGASNVVQCRVEVLRRDVVGRYTVSLENGAVVGLGEELLVRIAVMEGNGWEASRLGAVWLSRAAEETPDRVSLVTAGGCLAPGAEAVCPRAPRAEGALAQVFTIRAPMFQDGWPGSNVVLNLQVHACRKAHYCFSECSRHKRALQQNQHELNRTSLSHKIKNYESPQKGEKVTIKYRRNISDLEVEGQMGKVKNLDSHVIRGKRELNGMTAASVSVAFTVVPPPPPSPSPPLSSGSHKELVKSDANQKAVAMIIASSVAVVVLMLAVLLTHYYSRRHSQFHTDTS